MLDSITECENILIELGKTDLQTLLGKNRKIDVRLNLDRVDEELKLAKIQLLGIRNDENER